MTGLAAAVAVSSRGLVHPSPRLERNVLLIDLDDIGRDLLSRAMAAGGAPNISRLMSTGRTWSTFWAAPNCSLFRARVLTGADAYRPESYIGRLVGTSDKFAGPAGTWICEGLQGRKVKLGKWHMSGDVPLAFFPATLIQRGWDRFIGSNSNLFVGGTSYYDWKEHDADSSGDVITQQTQHETTRMAQLVMSEAAAGTEFIHASFCAIHVPLNLPPDGEPAGKTYHGTTNYEIRADMLFHLDYWLGVVVQDAVQRGYVVIVACDNGTKDAGKNTYKETGSNTPMFAVGAGVVPGQSDRLVAATDLWATVRRMRGDTVTTAPDSVDFCDELLGWPSIVAPRQFLTMDWYPQLGTAPAPGQWSRMIRDARWKYVDQKIEPAGTSGDDVVALHDLLNDPTEEVNLLDAPLSSEASAAYQLLLANLQQ